MRTENMREIDLGMSNFDYSIDEGFEEALRESPGEVFGRHAGWNFNGRVYFFDNQFHEEVWVYYVQQETISADTLEDLMRAVCERYGYD